MLAVVEFENGKFGLINTWTGILLPNRRGGVLECRTQRKAERVMRKRTGSLTKTIRNLSN